MTSSFILSEYFQQHRRQNPRFLVVPCSPLDRGDPGRSLSDQKLSRLEMSVHRAGAGERRAGPCPELPIVSLSVTVTVRESGECEALRLQ